MSWTALHPTCGTERGFEPEGGSDDGDDHDDWVGHREVRISDARIGVAGEVLVCRRLSRARVLAFFEKLPRCLVGIEACNTSRCWARELIRLGHDARLMPAQDVKP
jgi:transposase